MKNNIWRPVKEEETTANMLLLGINLNYVALVEQNKSAPTITIWVDCSRPGLDVTPTRLTEPENISSFLAAFFRGGPKL